MYSCSGYKSQEDQYFWTVYDLKLIRYDAIHIFKNQDNLKFKNAKQYLV